MASEEIRNGQFVYRDTLFAEVGEGKRHLRASASELKELLLPKKNSTSGKDQVAHWYEAQLVHYGLPQTKDKNAAKVRLLGAINSGSLIVPSHILQLEADLKKDYVSAQRKAKNAAKKAVVTSPGTAGKKRKANDLEGSQSAASITKMSFTVGEMTVHVDHTTNSKTETPAKRSKATTTNTNRVATPTTQTKKKISNATEAKAAKASPARTSKKSTPNSKTKTDPSIKHTVRGIACYGPEATGVNQHKCDECRRKSEHDFLDAKPRAAMPASRDTGVGNHTRPKQTARRSKPFNYSTGRSPPLRGSLPTSLCMDDEQPPPPYSEYDENYTDGEGATEYDHRVVQISGVYEVSVSTSNNSAELLLRLSHPRDQLWGRFTFDGKIGSIRVDGIDNIAQSVRKSLGWRSEDCDTGQLRFGKGCDGWIQFDGHGGVRGVFHGLMNGRDVDFEGQLEENFGYEDEDVREEAVGELVAEWYEFPERAYGRR